MAKIVVIYTSLSQSGLIEHTSPKTNERNITKCHNFKRYILIRERETHTTCITYVRDDLFNIRNTSLKATSEKQKNQPYVHMSIIQTFSFVLRLCV